MDRKRNLPGHSVRNAPSPPPKPHVELARHQYQSQNHNNRQQQQQPQQYITRTTKSKFGVSSTNNSVNQSSSSIVAPSQPKGNGATSQRTPNSQQWSTLKKAIVAILTLTLAFLSYAFFSTEWLASESRYYGAKFNKLGLWRICFRSFSAPTDFEFRKFYVGCRWVFADEYRNIRNIILPAFFIATQILFSLGFLFIVFCCVGMLAMQQCFIVDRESYAIKILSLVSLLSAICCSSAVAIFSLYGNEEDWMPDSDHNYFSWSFASALLGSVLLWIASLLFYIESRLLSR